MTKSEDRRRIEMPSRLNLLDEAEGPGLARLRVSKPDLSFRKQNCGRRALIQNLARPSLASSCGQDLYMWFRLCDRQLAALRFFIGTKRQNFLDTHYVRTNDEQPQRTAGRTPRVIPRGGDGKGADL